MKKITMSVVLMAALLGTASWVSACENCGCKAKAEAAKAAAATTAVTTAPAVKCVACPKAQGADATQPAAKCTGDCKAGCCKGDATKCATCPAAKTCPVAAATTTTPAATATACGAAKTCGAASKSCGYTLPAVETKAVEPVKEAK